jgi:cilia- and flagella-associated protein 43
MSHENGAVSAGQDNSRDRRMHAIVSRRRLVELAKAQAEEIALLKDEVERWRLRSFPTLTGQRSLI